MKSQIVNNITTKKRGDLSFKGFKNTIDNSGKEIIRFFTPPYDTKKYDISLETVDIERNKDGYGWVRTSDEIKTTDIKNGVISFDRGEFFKDNNGVGYRFKLTDKKTGEVFYLNDAGMATENKSDKGNEQGSDDKFTVILKSQGIAGNAGPIYQAFLNSLAPSERAKKEMLARNHFNDAGTTLKSTIDLVKKGTLDNYSMILSTPVTGKSHGYWCDSFFQISKSLGNIDDFNELITTLFDRGQSFIYDGAFTSSSLKSPQITDVIRHGENSPYYNWFKFCGENLTFGILPNDTDENPKQHVKFALINDPKGKNYNNQRPTYIQFYDTRMVNKKPTDIMESYERFNVKDEDNSNIDDPFTLNSHDSSIQPYYFQLDPKNEKILKALRKAEAEDKTVDKLPIQDLFNFGTFAVDTKTEAKDANNWDGATDLIKLNLSNPVQNSPENVLGSIQARNFIYNAATFWTRTAGNNLLKENAIKIAKDGGKFAENLKKNYKLDFNKIKSNASSYGSKFIDKNISRTADDFLLEQITEYPLDAIEFGEDLTAVLGSPYLITRPVHLSDQNMSRYDLVRVRTAHDAKKNMWGNTISLEGTDYLTFETDQATGKKKEILESYLKTNQKMNKLFRDDITSAVKSVLKKIDSINSNGTDSVFDKNNSNKLTPYGLYVAKVLTPEITRHIIISALFGEDSANIKTDDLRKLGLQALGIDCNTPKEEATAVLKKLSGNLEKLNNNSASFDNYAKSLADKLKGVKADDFKLSEIVMEQTNAGLNWRFDAAKDIADFDAIRDDKRKLDFKSCWEDVIGFWNNFIGNVRQENKGAYVIGEMTLLGSFYDGSNGWFDQNAFNKDPNYGRFRNPDIAEQMFFEETGATTNSLFGHYYNAVPRAINTRTYPESPEDVFGARGNMASIASTIEKYFKYSFLPSIAQSHTLVGNHDKAHTIHVFSVDMNIFSCPGGNLANYRSVSNPDEEQKKKDKDYIQSVVNKVLGKKAEGLKLPQLSSKAIATGQLFVDTLDKTKLTDDASKDYMKQAVSDLALGQFKGKTQNDYRRAEAFGAKDFKIGLRQTIEQAAYIAREKGDTAVADKLLSGKENLILRLYEEMTQKGREDFLKVWQILCTVAGNATLYNGDEYAQTGWETIDKNMFTANRDFIDHDIVNPNSGHFSDPIRAYNKAINAITGLHKKEGLTALGGGIPTVLRQDDRKDVFALHKKDDKGSEVITIVSNAGVTQKDGSVADTVTLDKGLSLAGMKAGATEGDEYIRLQYNPETGKYEERDHYKVKKDGKGRYYLRSSSMSGKITLDDTVTVLYKAGKSKTSDLNFKGNGRANVNVSLHNMKYALMP